MTHTAWAQYSEGGQFRRAVEVGEGRIDIDGNANTAAHVYLDRYAASRSPCLCLLPSDIRPSAGPLPDARKKPTTHTLWAQYSEGAEFREWVEIGRGTIEPASTGKSFAYIFQNRFDAGSSTYICLLPVGAKPPDPPAKGRRPGSSGEEEEF